MRTSPLLLVRRLASERRTFFSAGRSFLQGGARRGAASNAFPPEEKLLILFLALAAFPLLYLFRTFDDNTLTSWRWVFSGTGPGPLFLVAMPALLLALFLSRIELSERADPIVLFLCGFAAAVPLWSAPESIIDASRYFLQAKYAAREGLAAFVRDWGAGIPAWTDLPLVPFLYGAVFRTFGEERIAVQTFTTLLFALAVVQTFFIGRRLWDRETGFLAGSLLLAMPYLLVQVPLMLTDVPALCLVALAVQFYLRMLDRGGLCNAAGAAFAAAAAALVKYSVWPMLLLLPLMTGLRTREGRERAVMRSAAVLAAAAAGAGAFLLWRHDVVRSQIALLRSYQWPALGRWGESAVSTFLFQVHPFVTICAFAGAVRALRQRDRRFLLPGWFILFAVVFRVERIRYLLPLFPLFALMGAYGLRGLFSDGATRRFAAYSAVAASLVLALVVYRPFLDRTSMANLRDAGAFLDSLHGPTVVVRVGPQQASTGNTEAAIPVLDLFTRKQIVYERQPVDRPDRKVIKTAPLRFTWAARLPHFYDGPVQPGPVPVAVISGRIGHAAAPDGTARSVTFQADTGTFRYRTAVTVLPGTSLSASAQTEAPAVPIGTAH